MKKNDFPTLQICEHNPARIIPANVSQYIAPILMLFVSVLSCITYSTRITPVKAFCFFIRAALVMMLPLMKPVLTA